MFNVVPRRIKYAGWYFDWGYFKVIANAVYINHFAIKWNSSQPIRLKPITIPGKVYSYDSFTEPDMYIFLKFNISFSDGWGIGLTYK